MNIIPSFKLLYAQYDYPKPDLTIKAVGYQWYWSHEYPDHGGIKFDSVIVRDEDLIKKEIGNDEFKKRFGALGEIEKQKALYAAAQPLCCAAVGFHDLAEFGVGQARTGLHDDAALGPLLGRRRLRNAPGRGADQQCCGEWQRAQTRQPVKRLAAYRCRQRVVSGSH